MRKLNGWLQLSLTQRLLIIGGIIILVYSVRAIAPIMQYKEAEQELAGWQATVTSEANRNQQLRVFQATVESTAYVLDRSPSELDLIDPSGTPIAPVEPIKSPEPLATFTPTPNPSLLDTLREQIFGS